MADLSEWYQITPSAGANGMAPGQAPQPSASTYPAASNIGGTLSANTSASGSVILCVILAGGVLLFLHYRD